MVSNVILNYNLHFAGSGRYPVHADFVPVAYYNREVGKGKDCFNVYIYFLLKHIFKG